MGRKLDDLEILDRINADIIDNYDSINSLEDFESLIKEDGIRVVNTFADEADKEQIDRYTRLLVDNIMLSIEDVVFEDTYKYAKVLYEITK